MNSSTAATARVSVTRARGWRATRNKSGIRNTLLGTMARILRLLVVLNDGNRYTVFYVFPAYT